MELQDLFGLRDKNVIITGGLGLLGRKHAEAVAVAGGSSIIIDLDIDRGEELKNRLEREYGTYVHIRKGDVSDEESLTGIKDDLDRQGIKIDGLINNAALNGDINKKGLSQYTELEDFSVKQWNREIAVGLTGAFLCTKIFGAEMARRNSGGSIVNISSDLGLVSPNQEIYNWDGSEERVVKAITYSAIKSSLIGITRYTATYWKGNPRCNCVCPGGVDTGQPKGFKERLHKLIPMERMAREDEYIGTIIYMLSNASSYMNGSVVAVDGGRTCW